MKTIEDALAAIEEMKAAHEAEKTAILKKNKELIDREKAAKKLADEAEEARDEAANDAAKKAGDVDTITASLTKKHAAEIKKLADKNADYESRLSTLLVDNAISAAIVENGVMPQFARAVTAMLKADASVTDGEALANGVPLADHIKSFFIGDEGKHFVAAPANSGGGAQGSSAKGSAWSKPPETAEEYNQFMQDSVTNPAMTNAAADSWGRQDLKV
jgi:hypothetical protein